MKSPVGTWYCHTFDQFQSDESRAIAVHPDDGASPPTPARGSEVDGVTLALAADGHYVLRGPEVEMSSGTWKLDGDALSLAEDPAAPRWFDELRSVRADGKTIHLTFRLIPDAHDGLDLMSLELRNKPPKAPKPVATLTPAAVMEMVAQGKWKSRQQTKLESLPDVEQRAIYSAAWDAFVAGTFAQSSAAQDYRDQADFLKRGAELDVPVPTHRHITHAMATLDEWGRTVMQHAVLHALVRLPASEEDAIVAAAMTPVWLDLLAWYRFLSGVPRVWDRAIFPQPAFDDACRRYLALPTTLFSWNAEDAIRLVDGGPELARVMMKHHGNGATTRAHAAIRARNAEPVARALAVELLTELAPRGSALVTDIDTNTRRLAALTFALLFREVDAVLPEVAVHALPDAGKGYSRWSTSTEDKELVRASSETLPPDVRALVVAAFYL